MDIKNIKLSTKSAIKLSRIIDKIGLTKIIMELKVDTGNSEIDNSILVKELLTLVLNNLYKVENEVYEFVSSIMNITIEEAQEVDLIELLKPLLENKKVQSFLK